MVGGLLYFFILCKNVRIMFIKNFDVFDGLVNGVIGKILDIIYSEFLLFFLKVIVI